MTEQNIDDFIQSYIRYKETRYQKLTARRNEHASLIDGTVDLHLDPRYFTSPTVPATARRMVQAPVDNIAMDGIIVHREPRMKAPSGLQTQTAKQSADKVERWCQSVMNILASQPPYFLRELVYGTSAWGEHYLKTWVDPELIRNPEKYQGFPFTLGVPDPRAVFASLDMEDGVPYEAYEEKTHSARHVRQLFEQFNKGKEVKGLNRDVKDDQLVTFVEGCTPEYRCFFCAPQHTNSFVTVPIDGQEFAPNPLGFVYYSRGFSGKGSNPMDGDPASLAIGMLTGHERLLVQQARGYTMIDSITAKHAAPTIVMTLPPGMTLKETDKRLDMSPGKVLVASDGVTYELWNPPPIPPAIFQQLENIDRYFEAFIPGIVSGAKEVSGEAAISKNIRLSQASLLWESQYISAKNTIACALGQILRIVDKVVGQGVEIGGLTLRPEDIEGDYRVSVDIKPGNPNQERQDYLIGKDMAGSLPKRVILEKFMHQEDATQAMADMAADVIMEREDVQAKIAAEVLEDWDIGKQLEAEKRRTGPQLAQPTEPEQPTLAGIGGSPTRGVAGMSNIGAMNAEQGRLGQ